MRIVATMLFSPIVADKLREYVVEYQICLRLKKRDRRKFCVNDGIRQYKESWQSQEYHKDIYDKGVRKPCSQPHRNY